MIDDNSIDDNRFEAQSSAGTGPSKRPSFWVDFEAGAEQQYLIMLNTILHAGVSKGDRTGTGTTDLFGYQLRIDLSKGFPLLTTKKMFYRGIFEELLWFMSGDTHVKTLQDKNVKIWDDWATEEQCARFNRGEGDLGNIYGKQWRAYGDWNTSSLVDVEPRTPCPSSNKRPDQFKIGDGSWKVIDRKAGNDDSGRPLVTIRFSSGFERTVRKDQKRHKDPYHTTVYGVGYLGMADKSNPLYKTMKRRWSHMIARCYSTSCKEYHSYGLRGVTVCKRWHSFEQFLSDITSVYGYHQARGDISKYELDKDHFGSTIYSRETCAWLPKFINQSYIRWSPFKATSPDGREYVHGSHGRFAEQFGLNRSKISKCLRGESSHHKKWKFEHIDRPALRYRPPVDQLQNALDMLRTNPWSRR
ncbi:MAG: thymidylate synthase, partial [Gammaproteobacteria bacterium]